MTQDYAKLVADLNDAANCVRIPSIQTTIWRVAYALHTLVEENERLKARAVPELPEGWRLWALHEFYNGWHCVLNHKHGEFAPVKSNEYPEDRLPSACEAINAAINKTGEKKDDAGKI